MASNVVTVTDYYQIGLDNYTPVVYTKGGDQKLGGYGNHSHTVFLVLFKFDTSGIPAGSTITSVEVKFNIQANNDGGSGDRKYSVYNNVVGDWTDDGSTTPTWGNAPFDPGVPEFNAEDEMSFAYYDVAHTGLVEIQSTADLVNYVQGVLDGTVNNWGVFISMYTEYMSWYNEINSVETVVLYESGGGPGRKRVMVCS